MMSDHESNDSKIVSSQSLRWVTVTIGEVKNRSVTKDNRWSLELTSTTWPLLTETFTLNSQPRRCWWHPESGTQGSVRHCPNVTVTVTVALLTGTAGP